MVIIINKTTVMLITAYWIGIIEELLKIKIQKNSIISNIAHIYITFTIFVINAC